MGDDDLAWGVRPRRVCPCAVRCVRRCVRAKEWLRALSLLPGPVQTTTSMRFPPWPKRRRR